MKRLSHTDIRFVFVFSIVFGGFTAWRPVSVRGDGGAGPQETQIMEATKLLRGQSEEAEHLAASVMRGLSGSSAHRQVAAHYENRARLCERVTKELHQSNRRWNEWALGKLAKDRGIRLNNKKDKDTAIRKPVGLDEYPQQIYNKYRAKFAKAIDDSKISTADRAFLQAYFRYHLRKQLTQLRNRLSLPSSQEELVIPLVKSLVVLPLLTYGESGFVVPPAEFLPSWSKRPYFMTKMFEFCVLTAKNNAAGLELDRFLSKLTLNPDDDYEGHFEEHLAMVYRRNDLLNEAVQHIEAAIQAVQAAGLGTEHEVRLRRLHVEAHEELDEYEQAGRVAFEILATLDCNVIDRRSYRKTLEQAAKNLNKADNLELLISEVDELLASSDENPHRPLLLRQKWFVLRQRGEFEDASGVLKEMTASFSDDEQTGRCYLDLAQDCREMGRYEDFEALAQKIIDDFPEDWVAVEAAQQLRRWRTRKDAGSESAQDAATDLE